MSSYALGLQYVYLLLSTSGLAKIGKAHDLKARLRTINNSSPVRVDAHSFILCWDPYRIESRLHRIFRRSRKHGEWFDLSEDQILRCQRAMMKVSASQRVNERLAEESVEHIRVKAIEQSTRVVPQLMTPENFAIHLDVPVERIKHLLSTNPDLPRYQLTKYTVRFDRQMGDTWWEALNPKPEESATELLARAVVSSYRKSRGAAS